MSYGNREGGPNGPYSAAKAVTPSDSVDLPNGVCQALYVAGNGNVECVLSGGDTVIIAMTAGWSNIAPLSVRRVRAASTTATGIVALYV